MTTPLPSFTPRPAIGYANYPGNVTEAIAADVAAGRPFGPNYMGDLMWPCEATYDSIADRTRVGFSLIAPAVAS